MRTKYLCKIFEYVLDIQVLFPHCPYSIIITSLASPVKLLTDYQFSLWEKNRSLHIRKIMEMAGLHLGSVSMSLNHVAMRAHVEAWVVGHNL